MKKQFFVSIFCLITFPIFSNTSLDLFNQVVESLEKQERFCVSDISKIADLDLPQAVRILLASAEITKEEIILSDDCVLIQTSAWSGGKDLDVDVILWPSENEADVSVFVALPNGWKLSDFIPLLQKLDVFSLKNVDLVVSSYEYIDKEREATIKKGANLVGSLSLDGPLKYLSLFIGDILQEVKISGLIDPDVFGSSLSATLPGEINFIGGISARNLSFFIDIDDPLSGSKNPICTLRAELQLNWPGQDKLIFVSEIDVFHNEMDLYGGMEGQVKNLFGIYGLHSGDWFLGATVDYASFAGSGGLIPFSEFLAGFDLEFAGRTVQMISKVGLPGTQDFGDLAFEGRLDSEFSFGECINFVGGVIEENPFVSEKVKDFKEHVDGYLPDFALGDVHLFFSPKDIEIDGVRYSKGLIVDGSARLFGSDAKVCIDVQEDGMKVLGYLEELDFGCLKITGPGYDRIMDTPDDGLILDAALTLGDQHCFLSGSVEVDIFGGMSAETEIDVTSSGLVFQLEQELFDLFEFALIFSAQMNDGFIPVDFYVKGLMRQSALTALQNLLSKTAFKIANRKMQLYSQRKFDVIGAISNVYNGFWSVLANVAGNTFNITEFSFESSLEELVDKTHLPSVTIKGIVLGKEFELTDLTFDLSDPIGSAKTIIEAVSQLFE